MRISDWSSDVCSSDLRFVLDGHVTPPARTRTAPAPGEMPRDPLRVGQLSCQRWSSGYWTALEDVATQAPDVVVHCGDYIYESDGGDVRPVQADEPADLDGFRAVWRRYKEGPELQARSEEHTSELQSLMRISYAVFC